MDGGDLVYPLPFITAVVDTLRVSVLLQNLIADFRPRRSPFLGFGLLVPVGSGNRLALVLPLLSVIDFIPVPVKNVLLFLLRAPCAALFNGALVMIPSGFRGGVGVSFFSVNGSLLSVGAEKGFPVIGKSLSAVGCSVLLFYCKRLI